MSDVIMNAGPVRMRGFRSSCRRLGGGSRRRRKSRSTFLECRSAFSCSQLIGATIRVADARTSHSREQDVESSSLTGKVAAREVRVIGSRVQIEGIRGASRTAGECDEVQPAVEWPPRTGRIVVFSGRFGVASSGVIGASQRVVVAPDSLVGARTHGRRRAE